MTERTSRTELTPAGRLAATDLHDVVGQQIAQASIVTLSVFRRAAGDALELGPVESTMLVLAHENPGSTAARLARALAVSAPNPTMWLDKLQPRPDAPRASETDRRRLHLYLTDKTRKLAAEATRRVIEAEHHAFAHLWTGWRVILIELPRKL